MAKGRRVLVGKIDLDTCGAACLLGVSREDKVEVLRGEAASEDLSNPDVICIEVGDSGQTQLNNWDHHGQGAEGLPSATRQAYKHLLNFYYEGKMQWADTGYSEEEDWYQWRQEEISHCSDLVEYVDILDTKGPQALGRRQEDIFPTLLDVFAGMLLTERDPVEQLHKGVELLRSIVERSIDPFGKTEGFDSYAKAKAENNRQVAKAVEQAQWTRTSSGFKLAYLETDFFGAPGALYGVGAQVVVAFSPHFRPARVPKFTIAGDSIRVDSALPGLNALEPGWGGPPTGTILGSPRDGSSLALEEVVKIVKETL